MFSEKCWMVTNMTRVLQLHHSMFNALHYTHSLGGSVSHWHSGFHLTLIQFEGGHIGLKELFDHTHSQQQQSECVTCWLALCWSDSDASVEVGTSQTSEVYLKLIKTAHMFVTWTQAYFYVGIFFAVTHRRSDLHSSDSAHLSSLPSPETRS